MFLVHAYVLSGSESLSILSEVFSSEIAVKSFFVVSGFLIFMSYENTSGNKEYFIKRIRRIYPAYFFVVVACALLGLMVSVKHWTEYFSIQFLQYVAANLVFLNFLQPGLPGVFENNTLHAVNGALWTLKIEVMFYLLVPIIVVAFRKFGCMRVMLGLYISSVAYSIAMEILASKTGVGFYLEFQRQLPGQLPFFLAGAAGYYYFQYLDEYARWLVPLALVTFVMHRWLPWAVIQPAALGVIVIYFACIFPCVGNFGKYGDFSYGIYIVHFPILQLMTSQGLFAKQPWLMLIISGSMIVTMAFFLWHLVEKRFLRKSSHYVVANHELK